MTSVKALLWLGVPGVNFFLWFYIARKAAITNNCGRPKINFPFVRSDTTTYEPSLPFCPCGPEMSLDESNFGPPESAREMQFTPHIDYLDTAQFEEYRDDHLARMNFKAGVLRFYDPKESYTLMNRRYPDEKCESMYHQYVNIRNPVTTCVAIVRLSDIEGAFPSLRYETDVDENGLSVSLPGALKARKLNPLKYTFVGNQHNLESKRPTGYFRTVPGIKGRARTDEKMDPFLTNFIGPGGIEEQLKEKLEANGIEKGDDLIVMVVNEGEIDLFLNFACSCRAANLSMKKVFVFAASSEIITMIESTGAMGIYHEGYSSVSKTASSDYLDKVFVDMMWYKAIALFLIIRLDINVLFQDVDLVWFKDPFPYFANFIEEQKERAELTGSAVEGFFSDDGQRSLRYAPFYANSGFYYLLANERTKHFAWSIMISFDIVQVLGSHQNVFTLKLIEGLAMSASKSKLLSLADFPTGILYHHDKDYMQRLADHEVHPYNYHMCWTKGKKEKLEYLKKTKMWYLSPTCSDHANLKPSGTVFGQISEKESHDIDKRWDHLSELCCTVMDGAPY